MGITHIHPMLVHFPIVLLILSLALYGFMLVTGRDFADRQCLSITAAAMLVGGLICAVVAAGFGDIALDAALDKGFSKPPLEEHEDLAGITIAIFGVLAVVILGGLWKKIQLTGAKAMVFLMATLVGVGVLLSTAYHGGELVYVKGVNVEVVNPVSGAHPQNNARS
jgi:uncharacterized membrane protein